MADPFAGSSTTDNSITIHFDPIDSAKANDCRQIVMVQFLRIHADGSVLKPGTYYDGFAFRDAYTTDDGWFVDSHDGETTPDYQQGGRFGTVGSINGTTVSAEIPDAPQTGGGNKGFRSDTNPDGWQEVYYEFQTFCWCMEGSQCDVWYEGMSWKFEKSAADQADDNPGASTLVDLELDDLPRELQQAFDKFNEVKGFEPCT